MTMVDRRAPGAPTGERRPSARPGPAARIRVPEVALGVVLVVGFGLAAVLWQSSSSRRVPVTVLARDVRRGDVIQPADLRPEPVGAGEGVPLVAWSDHHRLVGSVARADLPAGLPLRAELVGDRPALEAGEGLVALRLAAGAFPAGSLEAGDTVDVVYAPPAGADADPASPVTVVAAGAVVWDVVDLADVEASALVTLRLPVAAAHQVSTVAGSVRLVRVEG